MIKNFVKRLMGKGPEAPKAQFGQEKRIPFKDHHIDPGLIDDRAHDVVRTLQERGFIAYVVGGAVRDLLLGLRPKDFDVATNATPEQVKACFRRAFIIGRRFRIVHVVYGRGREHEVIEVSTFRAFLESADAKQFTGNEKTSRQALAQVSHAVDASGRVLRDNVWGPIEEDATRRDFTINAMYYDPHTQEVVDFHKGIQDAKKSVIRMIGDPAVRYREDPIRIIRAIRFAAKLSPLGFKLESKTAAPLKKMAQLLHDVPPSRMFDEMLKLLQTGHALASIEQLKLQGLASGVYSLLDLIVSRAEDPLVHQALLDTDRRVQEMKPVVPSFLLACVLWSDVREAWVARMNQRQPLFPALQEAIDEVFDQRIGEVSGRGKLGADMREIWSMQPRFEKRLGQSPMGLLEQPRFRAAFDFMRLRAMSQEVDPALGEWWESFSLADPQERLRMLEVYKLEHQSAQANGNKGPRRVRSSPQPKAQDAGVAGDAADSLDPRVSAQSAQGETGMGDAAGEGGSAPKRRRRRRTPRSDASQ
jgi:poly(A) polymerase